MSENLGSWEAFFDGARALRENSYSKDFYCLVAPPGGARNSLLTLILTFLLKYTFSMLIRVDVDRCALDLGPRLNSKGGWVSVSPLTFGTDPSMRNRRPGSFSTVTKKPRSGQFNPPKEHRP